MPTERALDWRLDESYRQVCEAIAAEVYPDALRSAFPNPSVNSSGVVNWFARNTRAGQGAATGMAALYGLLIAGDVTARSNGQTTPAAKPAKKAVTPKPIPGVEQQPRRAEESSGITHHEAPAVNINVQIHISSDAGPGQIDQIFKSMSEHLYGGR